MMADHHGYPKLGLMLHQIQHLSGSHSRNRSEIFLIVLFGSIKQVNWQPHSFMPHKLLQSYHPILTSDL